MSRIYEPPLPFFYRAEQIARASERDGIEFIKQLKKKAQDEYDRTKRDIKEWIAEKRDMGFFPVDGPDRENDLRERKQKANFELAVVNWVDNQTYVLFTDDESKPLPYDFQKVIDIMRDVKETMLQDWRDEGSRIICSFETRDDCEIAYGMLEHLINAYYSHTENADNMMRKTKNSDTGKYSLTLSKIKMGPILEKEFGLEFEKQYGEWRGY